MRKGILLLLFITTCLTANVWAQNSINCSEFTGAVAICETFSDGDFSTNPSWTGDTEAWTVNDDDILQLNALEAGSNYLATPSAVVSNTQWEFWLRLAFGTSSNNFANVFLSSDTEDLTATPSGYMVKIGNTPDEVALYRVDAGEETLLIDGIDGSLASSSNNILRVKVGNEAGTWTLLQDIGNTGSYTEVGTASDNTYTNSNFFGIAPTFTGSNISDVYLDDLYVGDLIIDTEAPQLFNVFAINITTVSVEFSEAVSIATAENTDNYNISDIGTPLTATVDADNPALVLLTVTPLTSGNTYTIDINNIEDLAENAIVPSTQTFTYYLPQANDIIITEIFPDPTPVVGLPETEYIEIYNRSEFDINLNNWFIGKGEADIALPPFTIAANAYVTLTDTDAIGQFSEPVLYIAGFPSLTNSGDDIGIYYLSSVINQVNYSTSFYNDPDRDDGGYSMELINTENFCGDANNWHASIAPEGGTPSSENSVVTQFADTIPPGIFNFDTPTSNSVEIIFTETINNEAFGFAGNYSIDNGLNVVEALNDDTSVTLLLDGDLVSSNVYTVIITALEDCNGLQSNDLSIEIGVPEQAEVFDILINEIYADTSVPDGFENLSLALPDARFIELYNNSNKIIGLQGMSFADLGDTALIENNYILLPQEYVLLANDNDESEFANFELPVLFVDGFPSIGTTADNIKLLNTDNSLIHAVSYDRSWYQDEIKQQGGYTLEMIDPNNPCEGANNWRATNAEVGGTPAMQNSIFAENPDETVPDLLRAEVVNPFFVALYFSETMDISALTDANLYSIDNGIGNPISVQLNANNLSRIDLGLATSLAENTIYTLSISSDLTDCFGNAIGLYNSDTFGLVNLGEEGDLIISEFMINPDGSDVFDYIEIYNKSEQVINLAGLLFANTEEETGDSLLNYSPISTDFYSIVPNEYLVISEDIASVISYYGQCGQTLHPGKFVETLDLPSYNDDEGTIALVRIVPETTYQLIEYEDNWHTPLLDDEDGYSLERIDLNGSANDANNWQTAGEPCLGTPSLPNSQAFIAGLSENTITVAPSTFSPNSDGFEDFAVINYQLDSPGFVASITIFDERGRVVKDLVNNSILANQGSYKWDGTDNDNNRANIGIYIIYVELFDLNGNTQKFKKTCVLADFLD